jgi:hypothetical protein
VVCNEYQKVKDSTLSKHCHANDQETKKGEKMWEAGGTKSNKNQHGSELNFAETVQAN